MFGRSRFGYSILGQRINPSGGFGWPAAGLEIGYANPSLTYGETEFSIFSSSDGAGGGLAMWMQGRDSLRMQRLTPGGTRLWAFDGAIVSDTCYKLQTASVISDGQGGALAAWCERRSQGYDYYAQRMRAAGSRAWSSAGVFLGRTEAQDSNFVALFSYESGLELVSDGTGGAFVAFTRVVPPTSQIRLFVQRVDPNGLPRWPVGGLDLFSHELTYRTVRPSMCADGAGGLIVGAHGIDTIPARNAIWLQRLDRDGNRLWGAAGSLIQPGISWQMDPIVRSDGVGGAFVVWSLSMDRLMIQHVNSTGTLAWPEPVVVGTSHWWPPQEALPDGSGGLIVFWIDPSGATSLRAQRVRPDGAVLWAPGGVILRNANNWWFRQLACASDGAGGAFASWLDDQDGIADACEARWVSGDGWLSTVGVGDSPRTVEDGLIISPNPAVTRVTIRCSVPIEGPACLEVFDIGGRRIRRLWESPANSGSVAVTWDGLDEAGRHLAAGVYLVRLTAPSMRTTKRIVLVDH